jgi:hypothetical protein
LAFGGKLWAEARQRFWMHAEDNLALGDEAVWIWNLVRPSLNPTIDIRIKAM